MLAASSKAKHADNAEPVVTPSNDTMYPKKIHISQDNTTKEREPLFPEPSIKSSRFEPDLWNSGVASPSDSRRPREEALRPIQMPPPNPSTTSDTRLYDTATTYDHAHTGEPEVDQPTYLAGHQNSTLPGDAVPSAHVRTSKLDLRKQQNATRHEQKQRRAITSAMGESNASRKETNVQETSFIDDFLAGTSQADATWRQTTLDRMTSPTTVDTVLQPRRKTGLPSVDITAREKATVETNGSDFTDVHEGPRSSGIGSRPWLLYRGTPGGSLSDLHLEKWLDVGLKEDGSSSYKGKQDEAATSPLRNDESQWTNQVSTNEPAVKDKAGEEWLIEPDLSTHQPRRKFVSSNAPSNPRKSTAEILQLLPEDDLDFISASDIRASMGRSKDNQLDKNALRQKLEANFEAVHKDDTEIQSMIESKILNDQHVRRKERELLQSQNSAKSQPHEAAPSKFNDKVRLETQVSSLSQETGSASPQSGSVLETSLDFMSRWLHTGGNVFAQHFWQDPVQVAEQNQNSVLEDPFFKGVLKGIQAGRRAMSHIREDLAVDIPASTPLLTRLSANEATVISAATKQVTSKTAVETGDEVNRNRVRKLRRALVTTDEDYQKACKAIDSMRDTTSPSQALKRRMRLGADILQKNARLTRMMIFGLQTRFEKSGVGGVDQRGRDLVQHILALHDTQTALSRLVERVIQGYGVSAKAEENSVEYNTNEAPLTATSSIPTEAALPTREKEREAEHRLRNAAADAKLNDEVSAQKAAMRGLSDDGYVRPPKVVTRKAFDGPNPLAHSLFRPFALQLESLGKDVETEAPTVTAAKKEKADKMLVKEVKSAYEDVYGPITVEHRQVVSAEETSAKGSKDVEANADVLAEKRATTPTVQMLKEDEISPTITTFEDPTIESAGGSAVAGPNTQRMDEDEIPPAVTDSEAPAASPIDPTAVSGLVMPNVSTEELPTTNTTDREPPIVLETQSEELSREPNQHPEGLSVHKANSAIKEPQYTIYTYDSQFDEILVTTSNVATSSQTESTPIALHEALTTLIHPSKFLPHLPGNVEIVTAKPDMLVVRSTPKPDAIRTTRVAASASPDSDAINLKDESEGWRGINPIDGTARLSPTGFVGDGLDLERDFEERRKAAGDYQRRNQESLDEKGKWEAGNRRERKEKRKGGFGGVMKTAIVASATCYVVGVAAEIVR